MYYIEEFARKVLKIGKEIRCSNRGTIGMKNQMAGLLLSNYVRYTFTSGNDWSKSIL